MVRKFTKGHKKDLGLEICIQRTLGRRANGFMSEGLGGEPRVSLRKLDDFHSPKVGKEEFTVCLWRSRSPAEVYKDHSCCLNFPSAWLGEFPLRTPGYLKVRISSWEHMTGSLGGVALHLTGERLGWRAGAMPAQSPKTDLSLNRELS